MRKKGFEFSFGWIFAIMVGAVVISLALYATSKLIKTEQQGQNAELTVQLGTLLSPAEATIEESTVMPLEFPKESTITSQCSSAGSFGSQRIEVDEQGEGGGGISFPNKYIFSESPLRGKNISVLSEPVNMPFKVADILILWSQQQYCFIQPPGEIQDEIESFKRGISVVTSSSACPKASISICFTGTCDIMVSPSTKSVKKGTQTVFYDDRFGNALLYAAIFSDANTYECQVKRLMKRASHLSSLYSSKADYLSAQGCSSTLRDDLTVYAAQLSSASDSRELARLGVLAADLEHTNDNIPCKLF
ncbi:hypothetical protein KW805_04575 [Candidatus Pacearchaeota archaeon]|nr:hypothetical protein [Candidatus Pacearchaeota archaeon]